MNITWFLRLLAAVVAVLIVLVVHQKLRNDQVELVQPERPYVFQGVTSSLPTFGQTLVPRQAGLRGIYLPIKIGFAAPDTALTLHLRSAPDAHQDIRMATLPLTALTDQSLARFSFEPLPNSFDTRYYFFLESSPGDGDSQIELYYADPTAYTDGALYLDGEPQEFQAAFVLAFDRRLILHDWLNWLVANAGNLLSLITLTVLPGGALLIWLWPAAVSDNFERLNHIEWLALAAGLSLAIYPLLVLFANLISLRLGSVTLIILLGLCAALIVAHLYFSNLRWCNFWLEERSIVLTPPIVAFWLVFMLSAGVRVFVIRGQDIPMWQDGYHHSMISQLLVDHGGLFNSWQPYAPLESFTYHFGFHSLVAVYHWLTGSDIVKATLSVGQFLNLLTVPAAFLLGRRLGGSDWAGAFAALITGLISEYPMFYVNWSRYTQLAGQVVLPAAMIPTWMAIRYRQFSPQLLALTALTVAGLFLTHYRVTFFYMGFVIPLLWLAWLRADWQLFRLRAPLFYLSSVALAALLLVSPWLWRVIGSQLWQLQTAIVSAGTENEFVQEMIRATPSVFDYVSPVIVILAIIAVLWGSWQHHEGVVVVVGWCLVLILIGNPHFVGLPGTASVTYFAVLIAVYIPFSILAGFTLTQLSFRLTNWLSVFGWVVLVLILGFGLLGVQERVSSFRPENTMVTKPDLVAMDWIKKNVPPDAQFWINGRMAYGDSTVVGTDAGWWIPLLAERNNLIPPMIAGSEAICPPDYKETAIDGYRRLQSLSMDDDSVANSTLAELGVTHIYIGQQRGSVWQEGKPGLDPLQLHRSPHYNALYHEDQVWIFALNHETK